MEIRLKDMPMRSDVVTNLICMYVEMPSDVKYHLYDYEVGRRDA